MGAWADIPVSASRVRDAHRSASFVVPGEGGAATFASGIDPKAPEAKQLAADALLSRLGRFTSRYGSPDELLDALAADSRLAGSVQSLLAYGMLHSEQFSGRNRARDVYDQDAEYFLKRLNEAARAVAETAPVVLGLTGRSGTGAGGAIASIYA